MKQFVNILIIFILLVPGTLPAETSSEINLSRIFAEKKAAITLFSGRYMMNMKKRRSIYSAGVRPISENTCRNIKTCRMKRPNR
jgi:hypothetical protein